MKFPATKFLKSISTTCIPNYPDKNLPTVFVYFEGDLKKQLVGPFEFRGMNLTCNGKFKKKFFKLMWCSNFLNWNHFFLELEWILAQTGAIKTELQEDPKPKIKDVLFSKLGGKDEDEDSDNNDWWSPFCSSFVRVKSKGVQMFVNKGGTFF